MHSDFVQKKNVFKYTFDFSVFCNVLFAMQMELFSLWFNYVYCFPLTKWRFISKRTYLYKKSLETKFNNNWNSAINNSSVCQSRIAKFVSCCHGRQINIIMPNECCTFCNKIWQVFCKLNSSSILMLLAINYNTTYCLGAHCSSIYNSHL